MKKNISISLKNYTIDLITNGADDFDKIVICFHGFNGDKWGDAYSGLKKRLTNSLVVSFDSCGHGESYVSSIDMRLSLVLEEIAEVVKFLQKEFPDKKIVFVACSYGAYRVMQYLIKYRPMIHKIIYINPAFGMLEVLQMVKGFKYEELKSGDTIAMKSSLNKFMCKEFIDDLYENNLFAKDFNLGVFDSEIVIGERDSLIPVCDKLEIANKYKYGVTYVDDEHCFENKENWQVVVDLIEEE